MDVYIDACTIHIHVQKDIYMNTSINTNRSKRYSAVTCSVLRNEKELLLARKRCQSTSDIVYRSWFPCGDYNSDIHVHACQSWAGTCTLPYPISKLTSTYFQLNPAQDAFSDFCRILSTPDLAVSLNAEAGGSLLRDFDNVSLV